MLCRVYFAAVESQKSGEMNAVLVKFDVTVLVASVVRLIHSTHCWECSCKSCTNLHCLCCFVTCECLKECIALCDDSTHL